MATTATNRIRRTELRARARRVKLVLTDSDGVLTDTGVFYSETGEVMKRFSIRDGMGVERLRNAGVETAIITGEQSESVRRRAAKLRMPYLYVGVKDKKTHLPLILQETGVALRELAYIGDDVNDLEIIEEIRREGLTGAPADALPAVRKAVHFITEAKGGYGAFRDFAEWILNARG